MATDDRDSSEEETDEEDDVDERGRDSDAAGPEAVKDEVELGGHACELDGDADELEASNNCATGEGSDRRRTDRVFDRFAKDDGIGLLSAVKSSKEAVGNGRTAFGRGTVARRLFKVASILFKGARLSFRRRNSGE